MALSALSLRSPSSFSLPSPLSPFDSSDSMGSPVLPIRSPPPFALPPPMIPCDEPHSIASPAPPQPRSPSPFALPPPLSPLAARVSPFNLRVSSADGVPKPIFERDATRNRGFDSFAIANEELARRREFIWHLEYLSHMKNKEGAAAIQKEVDAYIERFRANEAAAAITKTTSSPLPGIPKRRSWISWIDQEIMSTTPRPSLSLFFPLHLALYILLHALIILFVLLLLLLRWLVMPGPGFPRL
ncbi:hypothetical protein QBC40DRAFT_317273 [Triangularia verruculosa]|uniref:Uncharacterized protein n=1 Tax=Triangularia verruculosa TaxID=2587418 RepID=A0AAN6XN85_9PEZI|nr:hypothetical protein QBC40DRAFT_317273 [Triangularia verruculosa]